MKKKNDGITGILPKVVNASNLGRYWLKKNDIYWNKPHYLQGHSGFILVDQPLVWDRGCHRKWNPSLWRMTRSVEWLYGLVVGKLVSTSGFVWVKISCYVPSNLTLSEFEDMLDNFAHHARGRSSKMIAGDFNAWDFEWGGRENKAIDWSLSEALRS